MTGFIPGLLLGANGQYFMETDEYSSPCQLSNSIQNRDIDLQIEKGFIVVDVLWIFVIFCVFVIPISTGIYFDRKAKIYLNNLQ